MNRPLFLHSISKATQTAIDEGSVAWGRQLATIYERNYLLLRAEFGRSERDKSKAPSKEPKPKNAVKGSQNSKESDDFWNTPEDEAQRQKIREATKRLEL